MTRLAYIANIRLPTEKAHGFQICKMCDAFASVCTAVTLYHPHRKQTAALEGMQPRDAFAYYNIASTFAIETVPALFDVIAHEQHLPRRLVRVVRRLQERRFTQQSGRAAAAQGATLYYTRDFEVANRLTANRYPTVLEAHSVPKGQDFRALAAAAQRPSLALGVALTQFIRKALLEVGIPNQKVVVEPDSVDLTQYADLPRPAEAKAALGLPTDRPVIGYIGRFETMGMDKGIHFLIEMMAHLPKLEPAPLLLCVGGPLDQLSSYHALAAAVGVSNNDIRFVDRVPNAAVPQWISAIDIATLPYPFTEHFAYYMSPMKLFEYLAGGKAIVSTRLPSLEEVLVDHKNGRFAPHDDPRQFAAIVAELLCNPAQRKSLEKEARLDAGRYTWRARAKRILEAAGE